ncbi:MAG TPA: mechanosensitive ion channel domain-containing protein [Thermoanaerobaculia bacterium]|nr:mechanosensitive ion channel domain-containing protein [Thermoanaerobaculia bacterium]
MEPTLDRILEDPWLRSIVLPLVAVAVSLVIHAIFFAIATRVAARTAFRGDEALVRQAQRPALLGFAFVALQVVLPAVGLESGPQAVAGQIVALGLIAAATWLVISAIGAVDDVVMLRYDLEAEDNLNARRVHTRVRVLSRTAMIVVTVVGTAAALMIFPRVRQFGISMLASAGIAGIVVGMAARPTLANLIAGLQIAFTEPIRIDDVVVVEGEWGRIEEITSTYVVVRIWDERRLIVPLDRMIQQPFQNWTRESSELLGTVFLWVDWSVPVDAVRKELKRLLDGNEQWDGRVANVLVTDTSERAIQLRALVSARNAGDLWELRVHVRERLVAYLQEHHPQSLPSLRATVGVEERREAGADPSLRPGR